MFRTVPLFIIGSFSLYTQQWYMSYRFAVCTVKNSWWWTEELSETCTVLFQKSIWETGASSWLYYKNESQVLVTWRKTLWKCHNVYAEFTDVSNTLLQLSWYTSTDVIYVQINASSGNIAFCKPMCSEVRDFVISYSVIYTVCMSHAVYHTGVLISPQPDQEGNKLGSMSGTRAISTTSRREL